MHCRNLFAWTVEKLDLLLSEGFELYLRYILNNKMICKQNDQNGLWLIIWLNYEICKILQSRTHKSWKIFSTSNDDNLITGSLTF